MILTVKIDLYRNNIIILIYIPLFCKFFKATMTKFDIVKISPSTL